MYIALFDRLRGDDDDRVVFLGIDGVPLELVEGHPEVFENLTEIAEAGSGGRLEHRLAGVERLLAESDDGREPGRHRLYGFQGREVESYETYVPLGRHVKATRLWDRVTDAGRDATVLNIPVTFPPSTRVQRMVSGFLSPDLDSATGDDELRETLERFECQIDVNAKLGHDDDKTDFIENAHATLGT